MKKILIVEDEHALRQILVDSLTKEGFLVLEAADGVQGYKQVTEAAPDIILLDVLMPVMDGLTMLKKIKENEKTMNIPVIMLTNIETMDTLNQALGQGAFDYIVKSDWKLDQLVGKVKERLGLNG